MLTTNPKKCKLCGSVIETYIYTTRYGRAKVIEKYPSKENNEICEWCEEDQYKVKVKQQCFICEEKIYNTYDLYHHNGNCCLSCNSKADKYN